MLIAMATPRHVDSPYLVPFDDSFVLAEAPTEPPEALTKKKINRKLLAESIGTLSDLQRKLYAHNKFSVLLVFQAMDAAGKDGTIRAVTSGINPAGFQVRSFKQPSSEELDHDFLWRTAKALPERGRIGVFNRSHYEEVLVVRVHPEYLGAQNLPDRPSDLFWEERFDSIREFEKHLARNGTVVIKFFLNLSKDQQRRRFLKRIDEPSANWKFSAGDVRERGHWDQYMQCYEAALRQTSTPWAPWYAIPADDKPYMRRRVAEIVVETMAGLGLEYPVLRPSEIEEMQRLRDGLSEPMS